MIPYGRQQINQADIDAVVEVLRSDFLTQGPVVPKFEAAVAQTVGATYAVAVNSATSALHLACLALGLEEGDWLWTSPITFVASANCARYCGAEVAFVDVEPDTHNMSMDSLGQKLLEAQRAGSLPKVVVAVHFGGHPCDMKRLNQLSQQYGFYIIEDASHAIGASYEGVPVGNCQFSDITVFSFHPVKVMTTGEGGMATTGSEALCEKMRSLRSHGIIREAHLMSGAARGEGAWYYEQQALGYNYRMTDLQAALGISQLQRLPEFIDARRRRVIVYETQLADLPVQRPVERGWAHSAWHLYPVVLRPPVNTDRANIYDRLRSKGIGVNVHYIPLYRQPYYEVRYRYSEEQMPNAEAYYQSTLTLPLHQGLSEADQAYVISALKDTIQFSLKSLSKV